jgi:hypothetical protein
MKFRLLRLAFFLGVLIMQAQNAIVTIQIKLIDGRTGHPIKNKRVGLEDGADYHDISVRTNRFGIASLRIRRDTVILVHNTDEYVNCGDERGGLVHNNFRVSEILSTGIVQGIPPPNLCGKVSAVASPAQLVLFVRTWRPGEKI